MSKTLKRLQSLGAKAGAFALSGVLALSMTPAIALANDGLVGVSPTQLLTADANNLTVYSYRNSDKVVITTDDGDPLNHGVELVSQNGNTYKYRGYAHSDGSHYCAYSLYTEITTDSDGVVTGIDLTSGNDTFAGKWGYYKGKGADPVEGYLPAGVKFNVTAVENGSYVATLNGADDLGFSLYDVEFVPVTAEAEGEGYETGERVSGFEVVREGKKETRTAKTDYLAIDGSSATITLPTSESGTVYNLVRCQYKIGYELYFNTYFSLDDTAKGYMNSIEASSWTENPKAEDDFGYTTNRDRWTHIMGSVAIRELGSWGSAIKDSSLVTDYGLDGEVAAIDTVSGATKTSVPFAAALEAARAAGYVKGVSEDVSFTIDGANASDAESLPKVDVAANSKDRTTVTALDNNLYGVEVSFPYGDSLKRNASHGVTLDSISIYNLKDEKVGTQGMMTLAKDVSSDTAESAYTPINASSEGDQSNYTLTSGVYTTSNTWGGKDVVSNYVTAIDDGYIKFEYENSDQPLKVTTKSPDVTHIVLKYTLGHGSIAIAYDLANMSQVASVNEALAAATSDDAAKVTAARTAYDALPYDVRPFTTGIANLHAAEAGVVSAQLAAVSESDEAGVKSARAAYDALDTKAKAQVTSESYKKLTDAETAIANKYTVKSVKLAQTSYTYSGSANKPGVTVKAADGSTIAASNYKVDYKNNTNAGTATVTVTGKGAYSGSATATFTIAQKKIAVPSAKAGLKYTGKAQTGVAAGTGYTVSSGSATDAGTHTATVALRDKKNYAWPDGTTAAKSVKFTIARAQVAASTAKSGLKYTGKAQTGVAAGTGYTVKGGSATGAGSYTATATPDKNHAWKGGSTAAKAVKWSIAKASNPMKASAGSPSVKYSKVKKKAQTVKAAKAFTVKGAQGKVTYKKASGDKKLTVASNGDIKVKKGTKNGTYKAKVKVTAAGNGNYNSATKTVTVKVKVK